MGALIDLTGKRFGRWLVLKRGENYNKVVTMWECICDCGESRSVRSMSLLEGSSTSCGCFKAENSKAVLTKYEGTMKCLKYKKAYSCWQEIKRRCYDPKRKAYPRYGGRGITMQDSWINDFLAFYNYIGPEPTAPEGVRWSVGRIDNNGNYEEGNVRWENDTTQARNHSIQSNNKTGIVGVSYLARTGRVPCWVGRYNEVDGKERSKEFSIKKYGYNRAKLMAIAFREEGMQKLKEAGAGYADSHGSVRVNKMGKINE